MNKDNITHTSINIKKLKLTNNQIKLDQSYQLNQNNPINQRKDYKKYLTQTFQSYTERTKTTSNSRDKIKLNQNSNSKAKLNNSSVDKVLNNQRTLSSISRPSNYSLNTNRLTSKIKLSVTPSKEYQVKQKRQSEQLFQQKNSFSQSKRKQQQHQPNLTMKQMFTSPNAKPLQRDIINKMKPSFEKGKLLPFKKESAPVKLNKSIISSAQKSNRKPNQNLSSKKETPFKQQEFISKRQQNNNVQTDGLFCLVKPIFQGSKYYQSSLIHFHYEQIKQKLSPYKYYFELEYSSDDEKLKEYFKDLFQEHFIQNYNCLQYCKKYTSNIQKNKRYEFLPGQSQEIRTLVFDLDETLIHCNDNNIDPTDHVIQIQLPNEGTIEARINIRPYCQQMLRLLSSHFELMLFTASYQYYADKVLELIDPDRTIFQYRFYRDSCIEVEEGLFVKDLRIIGNRKLENILLVDNASYSYCFQLDNGVPIIPFYDNKFDKELIFLTDYLIELKNSQSWINYNRMHFRTYFYQNCSDGEECLKELFHAHDVVQN